MSRADLASACGVTISAVGLWERGECEPSFRSLVVIVESLGLSLAQFFGEMPSRRSA
jgi:transcriptional regulator with XRE-family HTH domain